MRAFPTWATLRLGRGPTDAAALAFVHTNISTLGRIKYGADEFWVLATFPATWRRPWLDVDGCVFHFLILAPTRQPGRRESKEPMAGSRRGLPGTRPTALDLAPGAAAGLRGPRSKSDRARRNNRRTPCIGKNVRPRER